MRLHPRELNLVQSIIRATPSRWHKGYGNKALDAAQAPAFRKFKYIACPFGIQIYIAQITRETKTRVFMPITDRPLTTKGRFNECGFNKYGSAMRVGWDHRYFETFREAKSYLIFMADLLATFLKDKNLDNQLCEYRNQIELIREERVFEVDWLLEITKDDQARWDDLSAFNARQDNYLLVRHLQRFAGPSSFAWYEFCLRESILAGYRYSFRGTQPCFLRSCSPFLANGGAA